MMCYGLTKKSDLEMSAAHLGAQCWRGVPNKVASELIFHETLLGLCWKQLLPAAHNNHRRRRGSEEAGC